MAPKVRFVGSISFVYLSLCVVLMLGLSILQPAWAKDSFLINPVEKPEEMRLLPAYTWPNMEDSEQGKLLKISYLRGMIDALQYAQLAPKTTGKTLQRLKGLSLNQLAEKLDNFYCEHPEKKDIPPAAVVVLYLKGKIPPFPAKLPQ